MICFNVRLRFFKKKIIVLSKHGVCSLSFIFIAFSDLLVGVGKDDSVIFRARSRFTDIGGANDYRLIVTTKPDLM